MMSKYEHDRGVLGEGGLLRQIWDEAVARVRAEHPDLTHGEAEDLAFTDPALRDRAGEALTGLG